VYRSTQCVQKYTVCTEVHSVYRSTQKVTVNNSTQPAAVCNVSTVYRHQRPDLLNYQECRRHASMLENGSQEYMHVKRFVLHTTSSSS